MQPKILIVGRTAWDSSHSTLSSVFQDYPPDRIAYLCIESKRPDFKKCSHHFQISELLLLKKIFKWRTDTVIKREPDSLIKVEDIEHTEGKIGGWIRSHRSVLFLYLRELLWLFGGWKTKKLMEYINEFSPDMLFFLSDPLPLMNRVQRYFLRKLNIPAAIFMMDDIWSYKNGRTLYRYLLRKQVKPLISNCQYHFAISELMKSEYDSIFNINSVILTKGIKYNEHKLNDFCLHDPIKLVYLGQLIYGRDYSLIKVAKALESINAGTRKAELHIYTQTKLSAKVKSEMDSFKSTFFHDPVPYSQVEQILSNSDIVLFLESLEDQYRNIAWLSFSTKITDYLGAGKCIVAVGDKAIAPISYLKENNAAVICDSYDVIQDKIATLILNKEMIFEYARCSYELGVEKHNMDLMSARFNQMLSTLIYNNNSNITR